MAAELLVNEETYVCTAIARVLEEAGITMVFGMHGGHTGRIFEAFGLERCLWGTDWTRATGLLTYEEGVRAFTETDRLSDADRAMLMGGALSRVYGWSPSR